MNTDKLKEALLDLQKQRDTIEDAIKSLQRVLLQLNGHGEQNVLPLDSGKVQAIAEGTYVDLAVQLLEANGHRPMHVIKLVEQIRLLKNNPAIKRQAVESALHRHINGQAEKRIVKDSPARYMAIKRFPRTVAAPTSQVSS